MTPLLRIERLSIGFDTDLGLSRAVTDVSLDVFPGETVGLVGESGCGKTVTAMSVLGLLPSPPARILGGRILWRGENLLGLSEERLRALRGADISMVFQDPMTALSPLCRIGSQLAETALLHRRIPRREALALAEEWLGRVGLPEPSRTMQDFPHQLSGGMQQRVMIASALMLDPALVIADEPTTALDATLQAQVLDLMKSTKRRDTALLLITHDMGVVRRVADRVGVMYAGEIVETGPAAALFDNPRHPYSAALLAARPGGVKRGERLYAIPGTVPSPLALPDGCRFAPRCRFARPECANAHPDLLPPRPREDSTQKTQRTQSQRDGEPAAPQPLPLQQEDSTQKTQRTQSQRDGEPAAPQPLPLQQEDSTQRTQRTQSQRYGEPAAPQPLPLQQEDSTQRTQRTQSQRDGEPAAPPWLTRCPFSFRTIWE